MQNLTVSSKILVGHINTKNQDLIVRATLQETTLNTVLTG